MRTPATNSRYGFFSNEIHAGSRQAGVCLLVNKKARTAATSLGLTILLTVLWIYLPMLLAAPTDVVALNFFFDTLLFCGAILVLANSIEKGILRPASDLVTSCGADLVLNHPLGARTVAPAMAPASVGQQQFQQLEHGKARRTGYVIGAKGD
jgi:hypothetical protein